MDQEFTELYNDFTIEYNLLNPIFQKMPMYGIKDRFDLGWVKRALKQGKSVYGTQFYDKKYSGEREEMNQHFSKILEKFFLVDNQKYYSSLIS